MVTISFWVLQTASLSFLISSPLSLNTRKEDSICSQVMWKCSGLMGIFLCRVTISGPLQWLGPPKRCVRKRTMVECNLGMSLTFQRKKQLMRQSVSTYWQNCATIFQSWSCPPSCQNRVVINLLSTSNNKAKVINLRHGQTDEGVGWFVWWGWGGELMRVVGGGQLPYVRVGKLLITNQMASIFHKFIEVSAAKPPQATAFPQFAYMQHDIRKSYKQLKDNKGVQKPGDDFVDYWKEIGKEGREQQVGIYFRWIELLDRAIKRTPMREVHDREASLYVKKSVIGKWQNRTVKLSGLTLLVFSKHLREYPLKCFGIRKSKNKQHFSWVMQVIMQHEQSRFKSFHIGTNNIIEYQEWYRDLENRIDMARIEYFKEHIHREDQDESQFVSIREEKVGLGLGKSPSKNKEKQGKSRMKTITELVIDKELNRLQDFQEGLEVIEESQLHEVKEEQMHPNIFNRLFPNLQLTNFGDNPQNGVLVECEKQHRLYQVDGKVKIFITISHTISAVFRAISQSHKNWNPDIDVFMVKNKISSENSLLVYQKDKSKGFLYRERDFLFLKHCFSIQDLQGRKRIFMIEKSIDSIHTPPFMTVARGEKELIWCLIGRSEEKECLLIVEGMIKGGGYMNNNDNLQMTIKHHRKLLQLQTYLKQTEYAKINQDGLMFREYWYVNLKPEEEEEFYSPREIVSEELEEGFKREKLSQDPVMEVQDKQEEEFKEFIKHTSNENFQEIEKRNNEQMKCNFSSEDFTLEYVPPQFAADKTVIVPNDYLKIRHRIDPKPKGKEIMSEKIRGHHLWKGEWSVSQAGGLQYIDQDKMREQKKVLTFIIKRIGKNILTGKGILNISLPVDIFCRESNIERLAMSFGYCPRFLEPVANAKDPIDQLKAILASSFGSSLIYLTMEKPFNPILGETYQAWIDGCPVYFEQISHHPPVAAYFMKGRGYELSGSVEAKMDLSINSGTGINEGIFTVKFDNGRKFHFTTPPGQLSGLTYGERKLCMVDKTYFWSIDEGLFLEMTYNPLSKQRSFFGGGGNNLVGQQRLADYFSGVLRKYRPDDLRDFFTPKKNDARRLMAIPKGSPTCESLGELGKVTGRWTRSVSFNDQKLFQADKQLYYMSLDEKNPLPSHSNFREDVVYRRMNNFVLSQQFKEVLQVKQRKDRKLREQFRKKGK